MNRIESWGRYPRTTQDMVELTWRTDALPSKRPLLPFGLGKSYGDACLNDKGTVVSTKRLNHFISFDKETGILACEPGVTLAEILAFAIPYGWFLPVTPGLKYITIGGAIGNEVHGKNHHRAGTFCHHVTRFELLRSDNTRLTCSPTENSELFRATCGGIGLTGLITWAEFKLKPIQNVYLDAESIRTNNLGEVINLFNESRDSYEYVIASINSSKSGSDIGGGYFLRGNHSQTKETPSAKDVIRPTKVTLPIPLPINLVTPLTARLFNTWYFNQQTQKKISKKTHYDPFFYPQDALGNWNYVYGPKGFLQYQCHIPNKETAEIITKLLTTVHSNGFVSFLTTLKILGSKPSVGYLSFPTEGYTLAMDFPNTGKNVLDLFAKLDEIVMSANGKLYLAKDARMPAAMFQKSYPKWQEFSKSIDPAFSSSMWRRLTNK